MKNWTRMVALLLAVALASGCMYTQVRVPLDTDFQETALGTKVGRSHYQCWLWLFAWGDAGSQAAAQQGQLATIRHADTQIFALLFGLYVRQTTVVYGE